jgi:two-component system, OmpR family, phosphate regulon sensor histidine kinase PhoR
MVSSSRSLALLVALCSSLATALILLFFDDITIGSVAIIAGIIVLCVFAAVYLVLQLFIFKEITTLEQTVSRLQNGDFSLDDRPDPPPLTPLKNVHEEIFSFAEKKQQEIENLRKLEAFRRDFIADVSHELKTPIFAAQGFIHTLLDGAVKDRSVRMKFLKKAAKSLDGLDALVQDLLTLSQIETGQIKMQREAVEMRGLIEEVAEQFEAKLLKKHLDLRVEGVNTPITVYADRQRLCQVMTNLISNAIRHSFEGGEVIVDLREQKKFVEISVRDFGEGIAPEHHNRIFERFYRVDKSRTKDKGRGGTGLGLAIVKHILEGHNTKAEVDSTPGHGSVFSFKLPRFEGSDD